MVNINLLPWREELRQYKKKQFFMAVGGAAVAGLIVVLLMHLVMASRISVQQQRNSYIQTEITKVSTEISRNKGIEDRKKQLLGKIQALQGLYNSRFRLVSVLDEIVTLIPKRVHITDMERKGNTIILTGNAASNAQVTQFMKNINNSKSLTQPVLKQIIVDHNLGGTRQFQLQAMQKTAIANSAGGV